MTIESQSELARAVLKPPANLPADTVQVITNVRTGEWNEPGYSRAVITLTPALASLMLKRIRAVRGLGNDVFSAQFWDSSVDFIVSIDEEAEPDIYDRLEGPVTSGEDEMVVLRGDERVTLTDELLDSAAAWTLCSYMMNVYCDGVIFDATYKHNTGEIQSAELPLALIEEIAGEQVEE